jgi:head-tail adaptor
MPIDVAGDAARIFADLHGIAEAATYTPDGGAPTSVRAVRVPQEPVTDLGPDLGREVETFLLQQSDIAAPVAGDVLDIGGFTYRLHGTPVREAMGAMWRVETWRDEVLALAETVTLERATWGRNDFGERVPTWGVLAADVPASIERVNASEDERGGTVEARTRIEVVLRVSPTTGDLSAKDRLQWDGRAWNIIGAPELRGRGQWLHLVAEATS